jgi:hypothetical protein
VEVEMEQKKEVTVDLKLNERDINLIVEGVGALPYNRAEGLMRKLFDALDIHNAKREAEIKAEFNAKVEAAIKSRNEG